MLIQDFLKTKYPQLNFDQLSHTLLSPHQISLSQNVYEQAKHIISRLFHYAHQEMHRKNVEQNTPYSFLKKPVSNYSVLMSYDFHLDSENNLKLIEVNTNAAAYLFADALNGFHNNSTFENSIDKLKKSFELEWNFYNYKTQISSDRSPLSIGILDEDPQSQKMHLEFLMYQSLFKLWGWKAEIIDVNHLRSNAFDQLIDSQDQPFDLIYNRYCDFYLNKEKSHLVLKAFLSGKQAFSPQPYEYLYLADKRRLIEWFKSADLSDLKKNIPAIFKVTDFSAEELWAQRKNWFFKPQTSFGSKGVYQGAKLTKKKFLEILTDDYLVQEFIPPSKIHLNQQEYKLDFRFYAYKDEIQNAIARLYSGQLTNFNTVGGGFASLTLT